MSDFKEYFLQQIWRYQLFDKQYLKTTKDLSVSILKTGILNTNAGPDFLNAELVLDQLKWFGSVEIHIKSSDWKRHGHDGDKNYDNVILHVVWVDDAPNDEIPTVALKDRIPQKYIDNFDLLVKSAHSIPCQNYFAKVNSIFKTEMLEKTFFQRISRKTLFIMKLLLDYNSDWEQVTYHLILKNFGFKVNEEAFECIARNLPFKILLKHRDKLLQIEALLFGVAGLLKEAHEDAYFVSLRQEYEFLKVKYGLVESAIPVKFLRLRPANFPTIRLAQFADLVFQQPHLFSLFNNTLSYQRLAHQLKCKQSSYWIHHYTFGTQADAEIPFMGKNSIDLVIINTLVPLLIAYGKYQRDQSEKIDLAIQILHQIKPEVNHKTKVWEELDFMPLNSYDSQALIEWLDAFCLQKKCLDCSVGIQILKTEP
jgi:hypothetical protein